MYIFLCTFECTHIRSGEEKGQAWNTLVTWKKRCGTAKNNGESSPTKGVFMRFSATKYCLLPFSPRTSCEVRSQPVPAQSCDGDLGIHQAGLTPLSYRNPLLTSSWILDPKGIPASGKLRNTARTQSHWGAFTTGVWELICSGPHLPCVSRVREGFLHSLVSREAEHIQLWQFKMSAN